MLYDDRGAVSAVRAIPVPSAEFVTYCAERRKHKSVDRVEFRRAAEEAVARKRTAAVAAGHNRQLNHNKW